MKIDSNIQNPHEGSENSENHTKRFSEQPSYSPKKKQKTTAIGLSVVTCLLMGIIGFEIIRDGKTDQDPPSTEHSSLYIPSQTAILTAAEKEKLARQSLTIQQLQQEAGEHQQLIANLSEEAQALSYELLHTKVNLFGYQINPDQQKKIENLHNQIQDARQYRKELEAALQDKQQIIVRLQLDLEKSKTLLEEKNQEMIALNQLHEALHTRLAAEKLQASHHSDELFQSDTKLAEMAVVQKKLESLSKELEDRELALQSMKEAYSQLLDLYTHAQSENEKSTQFLQTELQALQQEYANQNALIRQLYTTSELESKLLENRSQELQKFLRDKEEYDQIIISQNQQIEHLKALELSLQENIEAEKGHSQTLVKELFAALSTIESLEKEQASHLHVAESLRTAEEKIAQLDTLIQAGEATFQQLQEDYQMQIAANEWLNSQSLKESKEHHRMSTLLTEKQTEMNHVEHEVALLQEKFKELQDRYITAVDTHEDLQSRTTAQLEQALIIQKDKELESQQLQKDLESLTAAFEEKETYVGRLDQELQHLNAQYQQLQTESLLAKAKHEHLEQDLSAQIEQALSLQKEKETEALLLQEKIAQLTVSLEEKEALNQQLGLDTLQLKGILADKEVSQNDLEKQIEQTLTRQKELQAETILLEEQLEKLATALQEKEDYIQLLQAKNEDLQNSYILLTTSHESSRLEFQSQLENAAILQKEKEALVLSQKEDLEFAAQILKEKELQAHRLEQEVALLQEENQELQNHLIQTREQQDAIQQELKAQVEQAFALHAEKESYIERIEDEVKLLQDKHRELLGSFHSTLANQAEREKEIQALENELERLSAVVQSKDTQITHVEDEVLLLQDKHRELQNNYLLALAIHENATQQQQRETYSLQKEIEYLTSLLQEREFKIASMEHSYQDLMTQKESETLSLQEKIDRIEREFSEKKQELANLLNQLESSHTATIASDKP